MIYACLIETIYNNIKILLLLLYLIPDKTDKRLNCYFSSLNDDYLSLRNFIAKHLHATRYWFYLSINSSN